MNNTAVITVLPLRPLYLEFLDFLRNITIESFLLVPQLLYYIVLLICLYVVTGSIIYMFKIITNSEGQNRKRVLIVIAHPVDECLYFAPTILRLKRSCELYLLCLTRGNHFYRAALRKKELLKSCTALGIPPQNLTMMAVKGISDNPELVWNRRKTAGILLQHIDALMCDEVYTFDIGGVSGHINHVSIFFGFARMCLYEEVPPHCKVYMLETVNKVRKFSAFADAFFSCLSRHSFMISLNETKVVRNAVQQHESQKNWYRNLYMYFSRYMYINTYKEMEIEDIQLVIQMQDFNPLL